MGSYPVFIFGPEILFVRVSLILVPLFGNYLLENIICIMTIIVSDSHCEKKCYAKLCEKDSQTHTQNERMCIFH